MRSSSLFHCSWEPVTKYISEQYEKFLKEEMNIARKKRIPDTRVHCCLYFISPTGHSWVCAHAHAHVHCSFIHPPPGEAYWSLLRLIEEQATGPFQKLTAFCCASHKGFNDRKWGRGSSRKWGRGSSRKWGRGYNRQWRHHTWALCSGPTMVEWPSCGRQNSRDVVHVQTQTENPPLQTASLPASLITS